MEPTVPITQEVSPIWWQNRIVNNGSKQIAARGARLLKGNQIEALLSGLKIGFEGASYAERVGRAAAAASFLGSVESVDGLVVLVV